MEAVGDWVGPGATRLDAPLADYGEHYRGVPGAVAVSVASGDALVALVQAAVARGQRLRVRGHGHSLNGSSLPRAGELVVRTERLVDVSFDAPGTVTVGAGLALWPLRCFLETRGFTLPVYNDGDSGPTVGGFVAAGGIGPGSATWGGFWENVAELTVVDGRGQVHRVPREAPDFGWYFGAMGQLGVVVSARLDIVDADPAAPRPYPLGQSARIDGPFEEELLRFAEVERPPEDERLVWFTVFAPEEALETVIAQLDAVEAANPGALAYRERYIYPMRFRRVVAPLIYPRAEEFVGVGLWGARPDATPEALDRLLALEASVDALVLAHGYGRYVQSELLPGRERVETCLGPERFAAFAARIRAADPDGLLNHGSVLADG